MIPFTNIVGVLDENIRTPLYRQLQRKLRDAIKGNHLQPEELLPAERDMANAFNVSRITVRKALEGLVSEGLLTRRQGAGTFVANRVEKNFSQLTSFSEDMLSRGMAPSSEWLEKTESDVTTEEVMNYGLTPGTKAYRFSRRRFADKTPMSLEYTIIPSFCLPSLNSVTSSLYEALETSGYRPVKALQRLQAIPLSMEHAKLLRAKVNDAGLLVERRGFLKDGRIIEVSHSYYRGDTYDIVAELNG